MNRDRRFMRLQDIGCIPCQQEGYPGEPSDVHHLTDNGDRAKSGGDQATAPLCPWHHRGVPRGDMSIDETLYHFGPSLRLHKKLFVKFYGTEREILAKAQVQILEKENAQLRFAAQTNAETIKEMVRHG